MRYLLTLALLVALAFPAIAAQRVVDAVANDDTVDYYGNPGANRYTTIAAAFAAEAAGDTIFINPGTYDETVAAINWAGIDIVMMGSDVDSVIIERTTNSSFYITAPTAYAGCKVETITFNHDGTTGYLFELQDTPGFTIDGIKVTGGFSLLGYQSSAGISTVTIQNSTFTPVSTTATVGLLYTQNWTNDWVIQDNTFDFTGAEPGADQAWIRIQGADNVTFTRNTIISGIAEIGTGANKLVQFSQRNNFSSDNNTITYNSLQLSDPGSGNAFVGISLGNAVNSQYECVDSNRVSYNTVAMDYNPDGSMYGIELESTQTTGARSEYNELIGNIVTGGTHSLIFAESVAYSVMSGNLAIGASTRAITTQGIRYCTITNNYLEETLIGIQMGEQSSPGSYAYKNYGNVVAGNFGRNCTQFIDVYTADDDSATYYAGNISIGHTDWASTPGDASMTLTEWRAYAQPAAICQPGLGSVEYGGSVADGVLRSSRAIPMGTHKILGSGSGLSRN